MLSTLAISEILSSELTSQGWSVAPCCLGVLVSSVEVYGPVLSQGPPWACVLSLRRANAVERAYRVGARGEAVAAR